MQLSNILPQSAAPYNSVVTMCEEAGMTLMQLCVCCVLTYMALNQYRARIGFNTFTMCWVPRNVFEYEGTG